MARGNFPLVTFNRGRISQLALARTDLDRTRLSAEVQTNWVPRTLGSMMLRPGWEYIEPTASNNEARGIPFIFSQTDKALLEISSSSGSTSSIFRAFVDDEVIARPNSTSAITGGDFSSTTLNGWTDADEAGSTSEWVSGNFMGLTGTRFSRAIRRQTVSATEGSRGLAVTVAQGRPTLKIGSSTGGDDYFEERTLRPGIYSLNVISTGDFFIELSANTEYTSLVESVAIESSGDMTIVTPWPYSALDDLRWEQSQDVVFIAAANNQQRRLERYATESWASVVYETDDGPFRNINVTSKRLTPSALRGNITLACDQQLFREGQVGSIFEITSVGQEVEATITGADQWSNSIRVSGVSENRIFDILVSAISTDITVRVQRSIDDETSWSNVGGLSWTSTVATSYDDSLDNQIAFYRIGSGTTDFVSTSTAASASVELSYASGGLTGIARLTNVFSATESSAIVLSDFGSTTPSELWSEGSWSDYRGFPTSVTLHEGRMTWAGKARLWASVSDAFESFDADIEGDSGPINRSVGAGPNDKVEWLLALTRLVVGSQGQEFQAKTSSLEEPLTPTNFSLRDVSTQGSGSVQAVKIDKRAIFLQRSGTRIFEISGIDGGLDYQSLDRTILIPEIGEPAIVRMAVQRQPDTRIHCVRSDGTVAMFVTDPAENVLAWLDIETDGYIEEVAVLPDTVEDAVYYLVRREIDGSTKRYWEKWVQESEAKGGTVSKIADSFVVFNSSVATASVSGGDHLVGKSVVNWANGKDLGTYTVSSTGTFTASEASTTHVFGLHYSAIFKSVKLAYAAQQGTALTQRKRVDHLGLILADTHNDGLRYGGSTDRLDPLPRIERSAPVSTDAVWSAYDNDSFEFDGTWDTDSRIVMVAEAPRPVTVLGAVIGMQTKEK